MACALCAGLILKERGDQVMMEPRAIAVHYLRTWFALDLLSSMPMDYFVVLFMHTYHGRDADGFLNVRIPLTLLDRSHTLSVLEIEEDGDLVIGTSKYV